MLNPRLQVIGVSLGEYLTSVTTLCSSAESKLKCYCQRNMLDYFHTYQGQSNKQLQRKIYPVTKL